MDLGIDNTNRINIIYSFFTLFGTYTHLRIYNNLNYISQSFSDGLITILFQFIYLLIQIEPYPIIVLSLNLKFVTDLYGFTSLEFNNRFILDALYTNISPQFTHKRRNSIRIYRVYFNSLNLRIR